MRKKDIDGKFWLHYDPWQEGSIFMHVNITEARAKFSEVIRRAMNGENIMIERHGEIVAKIIGCSNSTNYRDKGRRIIGLMDGQAVIPDDLFSSSEE